MRCEIITFRLGRIVTFQLITKTEISNIQQISFFYKSCSLEENSPPPKNVSVNANCIIALIMNVSICQRVLSCYLTNSIQYAQDWFCSRNCWFILLSIFSYSSMNYKNILFSIFILQKTIFFADTSQTTLMFTMKNQRQQMNFFFKTSPIEEMLLLQRVSLGRLWSSFQQNAVAAFRCQVVNVGISNDLHDRID